MELVVIFKRAGNILTSSIQPIVEPDDFAKALASAYATFQHDHPNVSLLDGVTVIFDKVD